MYIVTIDQMREIEKEMAQTGFSNEKMMENAGMSMAGFIQARFNSEYGEDEEKSIFGLIGPGNNGGDTLIALQELQVQGWETIAYIVKDRKKTDRLLESYLNSGGIVINQTDDSRLTKLKKLCENVEIVLDGILGIGAHLPLDETIAKALRTVQTYEDGLVVLAVDSPSGADCTTGEVSPVTVHCDFTLSMSAVKSGLLKFPAFEYCGNFVNIPIGAEDILKKMDTKIHDIITPASISPLLPARPMDAHKGTFGTALVVAGSINYTGAVILAAESAYRSGAGLVKAAIPGMIHSSIAGHIPEVTWLLLPHESGVISESAADLIHKNLGKTSSILIGPGIETEETTRHFLSRFLANPGKKGAAGVIGFVPAPDENQEDVSSTSLPPMVIDADALRILAEIPNWWKLLPSGSILTPHPGEMSTLTGLSVEEIQGKRMEVALHFAREWQQFVILKGALTVIASPEGKGYISTCANPSLSRAGSGDILAGLIAGFLAQGCDPLAASQLGVWVHGTSGDLASEDKDAASIIARDLITQIPVSIGILRELTY